MTLPAAPSLPTRTRVLVIGAGQAGLSVAASLRRGGLTSDADVLVVDRAPAPGGAWQFRWEALRLGAAHRVHDLPGMAALGMRFADADPARPARDVVTEYYGRYEEALDLRVRRPVEVVSVVDGDDRRDVAEWRDTAGSGDLVATLRTAGETLGTTAAMLRTDGETLGTDGETLGTDGETLGTDGETLGTDGETLGTDGETLGTDGAMVGTARETHTVRAEVVVNATGTWGAPFVPWYPGRDVFRGRQLDTTGYRAAEEFRDEDVVVVGGGTSAIGFLLELDGIARSTTWCTRRPVAWGSDATFDIASAVAAVAEQDAAARAGAPLPSIVGGTGVPVSRRIRDGLDRGVLDPHPMFVRLEEHSVRMPEGSLRPADAVIWATGFRPELRHLRALGLRSAAGGIAVVDGISSRDGRVFLAGYGPQASTIGADRAGRRTARQVLTRLEARDRSRP